MSLRRLQILPIVFSLITVLLGTAAGPFGFWRVEAANFSTRELKLSDAQAGATARYQLSFSGQSAGTVGSIRLQICSNDPFPGQVCVAPAGFNFGAATLTSQLGMTGFSIHPASTANELILTRPSGASVPGLVRFEFTSVRNPDAAATYYGRLESFASVDATGSSHDASGLAIAILPGVLSIRTEVPPYLLFCIANTIQGFDCSTANGNYIDFGEFKSDRTASGKTQLLTATNADQGFTVRVLGTTLTSGINTISPLDTPDVSRKGVSQFGLNLRSNSTPVAGAEALGMGLAAPAGGYGTNNYFKFVPGEVILSTTKPDYQKISTVTYIVNVGSNQPPGIYVSTLNYIALASF